MRKTRLKLAVALSATLLMLNLAGVVEAEEGNGDVKFQTTQNGDLQVKISDADGISSYLIREITTGRTLDAQSLNCEKDRTIPVKVSAHGHFHFPISVTFSDCQEPESVERWELLLPPSLFDEWANGKRIFPAPKNPPHPEEEGTKIIIIIVIVIVIVIVIIIITIWIVRRR